MSVRIASWNQELKPGMAVIPGFDMMAMCTLEPAKRDDKYSIYATRCFAYDEKRRVTTDSGGIIFEIDTVVSVPNFSPEERYLNSAFQNTASTTDAKAHFVFVRLDP